MSNWNQALVDQVPDRHRTVFVASTTTLELYETNVNVDVSQTFTLTLPSVSAARGVTFSFRCYSTGGAVTLTDGGDDSEFSDVTLNTDNQESIVYSDGEHWQTLD